MTVNEPNPSQPGRWQRRLQAVRQAVRKTAPFAAGVLAALAALLLYHILFPGPQPLTTQQVSTTMAQVMASATPPPAYSDLVYQVIQPSLVAIETQRTGADGKQDNGLGTGVIIDQAGDILTSLHVVADATDITLLFADGTKSDGQVLTQVPENDIAVVKPDQPPAQFAPAVLGNPRAMRVGDEAYVVGNPFGLYSSMSAGVISGFNRDFTPPNGGPTLHGMIQIDAAVNPGNSGGPLLNRAGQVIGIVTGILNPSGQDFFVGIGFAVPINVAGSALGSPPD